MPSALDNVPDMEQETPTPIEPIVAGVPLRTRSHERIAQLYAAGSISQVRAVTQSGLHMGGAARIFARADVKERVAVLQAARFNRADAQNTEAERTKAQELLFMRGEIARMQEVVSERDQRIGRLTHTIELLEQRVDEMSERESRKRGQRSDRKHEENRIKRLQENTAEFHQLTKELT